MRRAASTACMMVKQTGWGGSCAKTAILAANIIAATLIGWSYLVRSFLNTIAIFLTSVPQRAHASWPSGNRKRLGQSDRGSISHFLIIVPPRKQIRISILQSEKNENGKFLLLLWAKQMISIIGLKYSP
ncbi:MAG: hypothetical protein HQM08_04430 [Candidatus Riflebacteria bacterium]|nr:hypothetical protein [Candidatus Riflebacteria bacterium]